MNVATLREYLDMAYSSPLQVVSDCLRGLLISDEGKDLVAIDFAQIEARALAWLSGEEKALGVYRTHGKAYEAAASDIFRVSMEGVTKDQRQIGKVAELALGYGGGKGAFQTMAKGYGVTVGDERAEEIKNAWRASRPKTVQFWNNLNDAAKSAVLRKSQVFTVKTAYTEISYTVRGSFLFCKLPSKRVICYPYPKIEMVIAPWGDEVESITYMGEDAFSKKWERQKTYGGKLTENVTQAVSRDILAEALLRLDLCFPVIGHVHDEVICEVDEGKNVVEEVIKIASIPPVWAKGLPIKAEGWQGKRYRK